MASDNNDHDDSDDNNDGDRITINSDVVASELLVARLTPRHRLVSTNIPQLVVSPRVRLWFG